MAYDSIAFRTRSRTSASARPAQPGTTPSAKVRKVSRAADAPTIDYSTASSSMAVVATPHAPSLPLAADTFYLKSSVACLRAVERSPSFHNLSPKLIELRQECVAWLARVSRQLRFTDETMHLSVSVFDRFIINEGAVSTVAGLSLVAAASLNLAAKIEERRVTGLRGYLAALADRTSTPCGPNHERLLVRMESTVLHTLDFRLTTSTPVDFLGRFMCLAGLDALESTTRGTTASPPRRRMSSSMPPRRAHPPRRTSAHALEPASRSRAPPPRAVAGQRGDGGSVHAVAACSGRTPLQPAPTRTGERMGGLRPRVFHGVLREKPRCLRDEAQAAGRRRRTGADDALHADVDAAGGAVAPPRGRPP